MRPGAGVRPAPVSAGWSTTDGDLAPPSGHLGGKVELNQHLSGPELRQPTGLPLFTGVSEPLRGLGI